MRGASPSLRMAATCWGPQKVSPRAMASRRRCLGSAQGLPLRFRRTRSIFGPSAPIPIAAWHEADMQRLTEDSGSNYYPSATRDGSRMVFVSDRRGPSEVWFKDFAHGTEKAIFGSAGSAHQPSISADGSTVIYSAWNENGLVNFRLKIGADGAFGVPQPFCAECSNPWVSSSDARMLLFSPGGDPARNLRGVY